MEGLSKYRPIRVGALDEEGTPDIFGNLFQKLRAEGSIDLPIKEMWSMDWRAERSSLPDMIEKVSHEQFSFVPRIGEIVLFCAKLDEEDEILYDETSKRFRIYSPTTKRFKGFPPWRAGTIAEGSLETIQLKNAISLTEQVRSINSFGLRVECLPHPNDRRNADTKNYSYVPLHHIRPFNFYSIFLMGTSTKEWDITIAHAIAMLASMSLVEKFHIKGTMPTATIFCKGIYIGSEVIFLGDVVGIVHPDDDLPTDVLWVKSIRMEINVVRDAAPVEKEKRPFISVRLVGKAYTLSSDRAAAARIPDSVVLKDLPLVMHGHTWYPLHDESKSYKVSFTRVLGRLMEASVLSSWFQSEDVLFDWNGVREARSFSMSFDRHNNISDRDWLWAESRAEGLDLDSLNGIDVGKYDETRETEMWLKALRTVDGINGRIRVNDPKPAKPARNATKSRFNFRHDSPASASNEKENEKGEKEDEEWEPSATEPPKKKTKPSPVPTKQRMTRAAAGKLKDVQG